MMLILSMLRKFIFFIGFVVFGLLQPREAFAQADLERARNLVTCLTGRTPTLCKRQWLNADEKAKVEVAERNENFRTCITGRYPNLCDRSKLAPREIEQVALAEKQENLKTCLTGRYKNLCKKTLLSPDELKRVIDAEKAENLKTCLTGRYAALCDYAQLNAEQLKSTKSAETVAASQVQKPNSNSGTTMRVRRSAASGCESGHWIDSVMNDGKLIKLEDGSIWKVDEIDTIDSSLWLPASDIVICADKLINTDDNETVSAVRIR